MLARLGFLLLQVRELKLGLFTGLIALSRIGQLDSMVGYYILIVGCAPSLFSADGISERQQQHLYLPPHSCMQYSSVIFVVVGNYLFLLTLALTHTRSAQPPLLLSHFFLSSRRKNVLSYTLVIV